MAAPRAKAPAAEWPFGHITTLTADRSRNQWVKRIRGRLYSFGVLSDPAAALRRWQSEAPALEAGLGREASAPGEAITLGEVCGLYLQAKAAAVEAGELTARTMRDYVASVRLVVDRFGPDQLVEDLRPIDWERLLRSVPYGPTRRRNWCVWVRMVFTWAHDSGVLAAPPRFGRAFRGSSARERRELRARVGELLFSAVQCRDLIEAAGVQLRAMILLGINGGMGAGEIGRLPRAAVDLEAGVVDYARPKTLVERQFPLWPESVCALREALASRPKRAARGCGPLVFLNRDGGPWWRDGEDGIGQAFRRLALSVGVRQRGGRAMGFYTLRRTFRTIAEEKSDPHAVYRIMGHSLPGMTGIYVQRLGLDQLRRVTDHVRAWLLSSGGEPEPGEGGE